MINKESPVKQVPCPTCGKQVEWINKHPWRPFCCERCRIIDLGDWASEKNKIPSESPADFTEYDLE